MSVPTELVTGITFWPTGCQPDDINAHGFEVRVTYRGAGRYSVDHQPFQLSRAGNWKWGVRPFQRHQYRFNSLDEAREWALRVVDDIQVNGLTWQQWQDRFASRKANA